MNALGFTGGTSGLKKKKNAGDAGSIHGSGRSPGGGSGNQLK